MAGREWVTVQTIYCDRIGEAVSLLEERIYPAGEIPDIGAPYHVHQKKCSHWLDCNLAELPCCWSGINPGYDPFKDAGEKPR